MNDIIKLRLMLIVFAFFVAYQLARVGKKRQIGFTWSFCFGLLNPIVGAIIVFTSKKIGTPVKRTHILLKILGVILIMIGAYMTLATLSNYTSLSSGQSENVKPAQSDFNYLDESSKGIGRFIGGGILTIFVSSESYANMDYKATRSSNYMVSFLFIALGFYLLRYKKIPVKKTEEKLTE